MASNADFELRNFIFQGHCTGFECSDAFQILCKALVITKTKILIAVLSEVIIAHGLKSSVVKRSRTKWEAQV